MTDYRTSKQRLVNDRLIAAQGITLDLFLAERRAAGASYEDLSFEIRSITREPVTLRTVTLWCEELVPA